MEANSGDPYALLLGVVGSLLPVIGAMVGVTNWLNTRFTTLDKRLSLLEQQVENTEDKLLLLSNGTKEAIAHARSRFFDEVGALRRDLGTDLDDLKGYLAKEQGFIPRASRQKDI